MCFIKRYKIRRLTKKLLKMEKLRLNGQQSEALLKKEIAGFHELAGLYFRVIGKKKVPFAREMQLESYRAAARLEDPNAQYLLGKALLEEAKFREKLEMGGLFGNSSNQRAVRQLYEEAHAYLTAGERLQHVEAKRLHGLCYINGWGVPEDRKKGFEMVVDSIGQENSWDRVPQIFASIGLNKPEFFSALTAARAKS